VHLLLADPENGFCREVGDALASRGCVCHVIANPFAYPWRFSWSLTSEESASSLALDGQEPIRDVDIAGVFVQASEWVDPAGWEPSDLMYAHAETQAALFSWLWSLDCPVVNRFSPSIWYRQHAPLLSWYDMLRRCGLSVSDGLVTNIEPEARAFGERLSDEGLPGAVCGALTSDARYLVSNDDDWTDVAAVQRISPVYLLAPHSETRCVCVVGGRVVWEERPSPQLAALEPALLSFAVAAGLSFVEFTLAASSGRVCVVAVESRPLLDRVGAAARTVIAAEIAQLLTVREPREGRMVKGSLH
jgi:hypothetical protein